MIHKFHTQSDAWCMPLHVVVPAAADAADSDTDAVGDDDAKVTACCCSDAEKRTGETAW